jgi:hypothetical protein
MNMAEAYFHQRRLRVIRAPVPGLATNANITKVRPPPI